MELDILSLSDNRRNKVIKESLFAYFFSLRRKLKMHNINKVCYNMSYCPVSYLNASHVVEVSAGGSGRLAAPNWPQRAPPRSALRTRLVAPHHNTLSLAFTATTLATNDQDWPCGNDIGWIEVSC